MNIWGIAIENIVVGVAAALFVGLMVRTKNVAYNKYIEGKYPIEGEYLTTFEDTINGERTTVSAPAQLEQKGKKIVGTTVMPREDRKWNLEGELNKRGYINGIYHAPDLRDQGIGNFFFISTTTVEWMEFGQAMMKQMIKFLQVDIRSYPLLMHIISDV